MDIRVIVFVGLGFLFPVVLGMHDAFGQGIERIAAGRPVVCYYHPENRPDHIGPPERLNHHRQGAIGRTKTATFQVEYVDFPPDNQARNAFQYAIDIWESVLQSPVPIRVRAEWRDLDTGVLGQALWGSAYSNFGGEQYQDTFYPVALAEKISGKELNGAGEPDIVASFNADVNWYTGTDGNTPNGKMDLVTIVLHEIAHGLGFTDSYSVDDQQGTVGLSANGNFLPFVFDAYVENRSRESLLHDFPSPSSALASALQSGDLFFSGPASLEVLGGSRAELFAPATFDNGSSISHLDEATFNAADDANRLMTPQIAMAESIHDPGELLTAMLADIGWVYTRIDHQPLTDTERMDGSPYKITISIKSDNGYLPGQVKLHYTSDGTNFTNVTMAPTGTANEFEYSLPGKTVKWAYGYYVSVTDVNQRVFTRPGLILERGKEPEQGTYFFEIGPDQEPPVIKHQPVTFLSQDDRVLNLTAEVTDNLGLKEVVAEYFFEESAVRTVVMEESKPGIYTVHLPVEHMEIGDQIQYRIIARDQANQENIATMPSEGFVIVSITGILPVQRSYQNNFDEVTFDFFGDHFAIHTPESFPNGAIHSHHPYADGSGPNNESNYTYQLQIPIKIDQSNPVMQFDEIVLVEPGDAGSVFGNDGFFDYVIVEGSVDGGASWKPFAPGYDARENSVWLSRYNALVDDYNSRAVGSADLYQRRTIDLVSNGNFKHGDEVLIRFRLFADQLAHGWGWAIDNLYIQGPVTDTEKPVIRDFAVYPVPVRDDLFVEVPTDGNPALVKILNTHGKTLWAEIHTGSDGKTQMAIDVRMLPPGIHLLRIEVNGRIYARKFLKSD